MFSQFKKAIVSTLCSAGLLVGAVTSAPAAHAQSTAHEASVMSGMSLALPIAVSVAAPALALTAASQLTVVAVDSSVRGTVWVLKNVANGAEVSIRFAGDMASAVALGAGMVLSTTVIATGTLLHHGNQAIAFLPNEKGAMLSHHERLTW